MSIDPLTHKDESIPQRMAGMCFALFSMMAPGQTITLKIPKSKIIVPGYNNQGGELIVTKPALRTEFTANSDKINQGIQAMQQKKGNGNGKV